MASSVIRARIAPIALVVAIAFVIVGFLRADREMTQAERDRASAIVSESATLVEVFLLRELMELHSIQLTIDDHVVNNDSVRAVLRNPSRVSSHFETLSLIDSSLGIRSAFPTKPAAWLLEDTTKLRNIVQRYRSQNDQAISVDVNTQQRRLIFIETRHEPSNKTLIATLATDSLIALLERQQRRGPFGLVVQSGVDTVVQIFPKSPNVATRTVTRSISTPVVRDWTVTLLYSPVGRGARIALWVVGLGAVMGLGVGLLLERRETSRIADRSSELEHLSTELLRANRAKSEFLANVSHELRTPLNAIVGFVDLLRDGVYGPLNSRQAGPVERIEASANHLRHLVDQILDLAKMAAGRLEVHSEPLELRPFVFNVASEVEPLMTEKGLSFSLAVGASLPRVRTDPTHLRQILINLLGNAVKFTANGGISVRGKLIRRNDEASAGDDPSERNIRASSQHVNAAWIALQVADSGIGIPEKDRDRIFNEFEQVNAGPRGDSMRRGTGLGLSISRRLARLLGGDITVESELGRGSVFTVWLPVDPADLRGDQAA